MLKKSDKQMKNKQKRIELREYRLRRSRKHRALMRLLELIKPTQLKPHLDKSLRYLGREFGDNQKSPKSIVVPRVFSLGRNFEATVTTLSSLVCSLMYKQGHVVLDFSNCHFVSFSALFFLKQILRQYVEDQMRFIKTISIGKQRKIKIKVAQPQNEEDLKVLKYLHALELYSYEGFK